MRLHSQRRCHGDDMKEQYYVSAERVWKLLAQQHLEVHPQALVGHPESHAQRHQCPEQPDSTAGCECIQQECNRAGKKENELRDVA